MMKNELATQGGNFSLPDSYFYVNREEGGDGKFYSKFNGKSNGKLDGKPATHLGGQIPIILEDQDLVGRSRSYKTEGAFPYQKIDDLISLAGFPGFPLIVRPSNERKAETEMSLLHNRPRYSGERASQNFLFIRAHAIERKLRKDQGYLARRINNGKRDLC